MITLDATLKTAQDGVNHRPIVEIVSSPMGDIVPVLGNYYNTLTSDEAEPHIISLSTGRLAVVMQRINPGTGNPWLYYLYTPTDQSEWIEVQISPDSCSDPCICELTNGNIGIVFMCGTDLYYKIITQTGSIVVDNTLLYDPGANWTGNPYVLTLANDTYILVYPEGTGSPPSLSNTYYLKQRTSSNFTSWNSATDITPSAFSSNKYCNNPHISQVTSGRLFLHLDYLNEYTNETELNNIYMMYSDDNGTSWSAAEKITDYSIGNSGTHPTAVEDSSGDLTFMYAEKSVVKTLDVNMTGYPYGDIQPGGQLNFNPNTGELYWSHGIGTVVHPLHGLTTIDIGAWEWTETITELTVPPLDSVYWSMFPSDSEWSAARCGDTAEVQTYNHINQTTRNYTWGYSGGGDVSYILPTYGNNMAVRSGCIAAYDGIKRLYLLHVGGSTFSLGWLDLEEIADPITGLYTYHEIWDGGGVSTTVNKFVLGDAAMKWDYVFNRICTHSWSYRFGGSGGIVAWNPITGIPEFEICHNLNYGAPYSGAMDFQFMANGDVYFSFPYYADQADRRGLAHYEASSGTVSYHEPTWSTQNDYQLKYFNDMGDGRILMASNNTLANGGGVVIYNTNTDSWEIINNDTYPGFGHTNSLWFGLKYDSATKTIYALYDDEIIAFSEYGPYSILKQTTIDNVDSTIDYGSYIDFSHEFFEYQPNIVYDDNNILWIVWQHIEGGSEDSAKWANLIGDFDITDDLTITSPISIEWDIEKPGKLIFSLAKGHLYDPQNLMSTLSPFLKKGRKIVVRFGEEVSSTEYWQDQGSYCVKTVSLEYKTDSYPEIKITAEDFRILWEDHEVIATPYYDGQSPHNVLEGVLLNYAELEAGDMDIPATFENEHLLYHQFVNMNLDDVVKELLDHFGYYPFVNVDNEFQPRYIDLSKATDHVYSDTTQLIAYSPNDQYSTFINRIIVKGISHSYTEILYEEENIMSTNGTTGWWGKKTDEYVWYSEDHNRTCRYPRLEIIQSVTEFKIFGIKGGGSESISSVDPDEHYVIITIEAPNYMGVLFATVGAMVAIGSMCSRCDGVMGMGFCGWCIYMLIALLNIMLMILGAIASYNYNIWARSIGHEKKTFQARADDEEFQSELGNKIVTVTIDDPMCYTISGCQIVANQEMDIVKAQRRRLKFKKTAHLQDEIGDILELSHPYSGETLKILVPNLKRTMRIGKEFIDEIQGWRI